MTEQNFLILHGLGGSGPDHWQSWLAAELTKRNHHVCYPTFSNYDAPDKKVWLEKLAAAIETIPKNQPLTVITHSLGCLLWLHYAASLNKRIARQAILVAPPSPTRVLAEAKSFFPVPLEKKHLLKAAGETLFVHSSNDPYCSLTEAKNFMNIGLPVHVLPNAGHINVDSGHGKWPWILDASLSNDANVLTS